MSARQVPHIHCSKDHIREAFTPWMDREHRMEHVAHKDGVDYINDSFATNVNAVYMALEEMRQKVVWLVGGSQLVPADWKVLLPLVKHKVVAIYTLNEDRAGILGTFFGAVDVMLHAPDMHEAVVSATVIAEQGQAVLLSPGCASFDQYANYEERGERFREVVRSL